MPTFECRGDVRRFKARLLELGIGADSYEYDEAHDTSTPGNQEHWYNFYPVTAQAAVLFELVSAEMRQ